MWLLKHLLNILKMVVYCLVEELQFNLQLWCFLFIV